MTIVTLNKDASIQRVYLVHSLLGDGKNEYSFLAEKVPFTLYAHQLTNPEKLVTSISQLAEDYVEELLGNEEKLNQNQPQKSIILSGWSTGGLIAIEMKRHLQAKGFNQVSLVLIDTSYPAVPTLDEVLELGHYLAKSYNIFNNKIDCFPEPDLSTVVEYMFSKLIKESRMSETLLSWVKSLYLAEIDYCQQWQYSSEDIDKVHLIAASNNDSVLINWQQQIPTIIIPNTNHFNIIFDQQTFTIFTEIILAINKNYELHQEKEVTILELVTSHVSFSNDFDHDKAEKQAVDAVTIFIQLVGEIYENKITVEEYLEKINYLLRDVVVKFIFEADRLVKKLIKNGASPNNMGSGKYTILQYAAKKEYLKIMEVLINSKVKLEDNRGFHCVSRGQGHYATIALERTALIVATVNNKINSVRFLLDHHANFNAKDRFGQTSLIIAARQGFAGIVELLLKKPVDQEQLYIAFSYAIIEDRNEVVQLFIAEKINLNERLTRWGVPIRLPNLLWLAIHKERLNIAIDLLKGGAFNEKGYMHDEKTSADILLELAEKEKKEDAISFLNSYIGINHPKVSLSSTQPVGYENSSFRFFQLPQYITQHTVNAIQYKGPLSFPSGSSKRSKKSGIEIAIEMHLKDLFNSCCHLTAGVFSVVEFYQDTSYETVQLYAAQLDSLGIKAVLRSPASLTDELGAALEIQEPLDEMLKKLDSINRFGLN